VIAQARRDADRSRANDHGAPLRNRPPRLQGGHGFARAAQCGPRRPTIPRRRPAAATPRATKHTTRRRTIPLRMNAWSSLMAHDRTRHGVHRRKGQPSRSNPIPRKVLSATATCATALGTRRPKISNSHATQIRSPRQGRRWAERFGPRFFKASAARALNESRRAVALRFGQAMRTSR
jgi:hypothetical protein